MNNFYKILIIFVLFFFIFLIYKILNPVPDLVFYYSDDNKISKYSKLNFGTTLISNIGGNIIDKNITNKNISNIIGYFTQYKICNLNKNNTAYVTNI
jgi:hypothetical protein